MTDLPLQEFARRLASAMPVLCRSMMRYEEDLLSAEALTPQQFTAMRWLGERELATMHEWAIALGMKASSATQLADRLVGLGLIERKPGEDDRRKVLITLTARGREVMAKTVKQKTKALMETFRPLTAEERKHYLALIETLAERLEKDVQGVR